jgi:anti-sigma B factor antagonist
MSDASAPQPVIRSVAVSPPGPGRSATVCLGGDFNMAQSPAVHETLARLQADRPARLIVDLTAVNYMDSSGLAVLIQALQQVRRHGGGRLILVGPNARVRSIFQIAKLDTLFQIVNSQAEADSP